MQSKQAVDCLPRPISTFSTELTEDKRFSTDERAQCDCVSER
jgi:hypothetical protein